MAHSPIPGMLELAGILFAGCLFAALVTGIALLIVGRVKRRRGVWITGLVLLIASLALIAGLAAVAGLAILPALATAMC